MWEWMYRSTFFLTLALVGGEWSVSRLGHFTPGERDPGTHWIGWVDDIEERKFLTLPGIGSPTSRSYKIVEIERTESQPEKTGRKKPFCSTGTNGVNALLYCRVGVVVITPCSTLTVNQHFVGTCRLRLYLFLCHQLLICALIRRTFEKHLYRYFTVFAVHFKLKFGYLTCIMLVILVSHMQW
jgi:hypothetical protein